MEKGSKVTMPDPDLKQVQQERLISEARADHLCAEVMGRGCSCATGWSELALGSSGMCPEDGASSGVWPKGDTQIFVE